MRTRRRSEEHTSELQSPCNLVCRLLLEKKKENSPELKTLFSNLRSAGMSLKGVAKQLGLGVVEIVVQDPHRPGLLADASQLFSQLGISIRQALVDDPELAPEPKLVLIGEKVVPGEIIPKLLKIHGVTRVSVY